jgi:trk system potassium uptake protein TrkH
LAVITTLVLVLIGTIVFLVSENRDESFRVSDRLMISLFQAVSAQTTDGYSTVDIGKISSASLFMLIALMFIGASPGSTGGGIKTTTLGTLFLCSKSYILGDKDVNFQKRRLSEEAIKKAFTILFLFLIVSAVDMIILTWEEKFQFHQIMFEIVSALGNVGLSTGITAGLQNVSKALLIITMFIGRVGPLTIGFAFVGKRSHRNFRYPVGDVFIG